MYFYCFISDTMIVSDGKADIKAPAVWGALWAMETFTQLVYQTSCGEVGHGVVKLKQNSF